MPKNTFTSCMRSGYGRYAPSRLMKTGTAGLVFKQSNSGWLASTACLIWRIVALFWRQSFKGKVKREWWKYACSFWQFFSAFQISNNLSLLICGNGKASQLTIHCTYNSTIPLIRYYCIHKAIRHLKFPQEFTGWQVYRGDTSFIAKCIKTIKQNYVYPSYCHAYSKIFWELNF